MADSSIFSAIIVAAGVGRRMHSAIPKQFLLLDGRPILAFAIANILKTMGLREIILVVAADQIDAPELEACLPSESVVPIKIVVGGERRQDSVYNGLKLLDPQTEIVVIHDGVRPFIKPALIDEIVRLCAEFDGAIPATPAVETLKEVAGNIVLKTLDRTKIWRAQTPQAFRRTILERAYANARANAVNATDDATLVELIGGKIAIVENSANNIKITCQNDLEIAKSILRHWES
ncbi:MAG: 2-C-methyl-D-erythritol 4-phosphate cytidylyltransferase [Candidatus Neomarinimicrobiota bacterium]